MRETLASVPLLFLFGILSAAMPADKITYLECRADNEDTSSLFALDDTTQKVCDHAVQPTGSRRRPSTRNSSAGRTAARPNRSIARARKSATSTACSSLCTSDAAITSRRRRASFASPDSGLGGRQHARPRLAFTHSTTSALSALGRAARLPGQNVSRFYLGGDADGHANERRRCGHCGLTRGAARR
jgi:hypothetical protein